jgi:pilus assembly protein Flp/PilA
MANFMVVSASGHRALSAGLGPMEPGAVIMKKLFAKFAADESGATAIEYGLIAGLIGVVIITAVTTVGTKVSNQFSAIAAKLN